MTKRYLRIYDNAELNLCGEHAESFPDFMELTDVEAGPCDLCSYAEDDSKALNRGIKNGVFSLILTLFAGGIIR